MNHDNPYIYAIIIILLITGAFIYLQFQNENTQTVKIAKIHQLDQTENIGPAGENIVLIKHKTWPKEGKKISKGEQLEWTGSIQWNGPNGKTIEDYGRSQLGLYLILSQNKSNKELHPTLLLGDYSKSMGVPIYSESGEYVYVDHDEHIIDNLGDSDNLSSEEFNLTVVYK